MIYDIGELMGDSEAAVREYSTTIDPRWLDGSTTPSPVRRATLVSADRDLAPGDIRKLRRAYAAAAADWESGAIARVAARNGTRVLILRGVSDLVDSVGGGEAYGKPEVFAQGALEVMWKLFRVLPDWLAVAIP